LVPYDRYSDSGEINTEVVDPAATVVAIAVHEADGSAALDRLDGLTVDYGDWWYNLRPSNTEPLLRLNVEAATPALCAMHVAEVQDMIAAHAGTVGDGK
jgi:phosphomannomutase